MQQTQLMCVQTVLKTATLKSGCSTTVTAESNEPKLGASIVINNKESQ